MISVLTKKILKECGLKQKELAELLGVPLQRVKRLAGGEAKKFSREEAEVLVKKLHIRGDWLATGEGSMFQPDNEVELHRRLDAVSTATQKANLPELSEEQRRLLQQILHAAELGDGSALAGLVQEPLHRDEQELLALFRTASLQVKAAVLGALTAGSTADTRGDTSISVKGKGNRVAGKDYYEK
ncbi:helix-turn-helix domain-containing protein [Marinobacterium litorale]|uniref:helix-turn-helix domain-containing protein n=1 Tax=Marinobacterium litorale TaxID=404770 RepID=UPI0004183A87|nr:helix-turn-helix transcriptional regulator [Marinobacterium litorale]